jgi:predicted negative regulator of RcsB-dependent stress response
MMRATHSRMLITAAGLALALCFTHGCSPRDDVDDVDDVEPSAWLADLERAHAAADTDPPEAASTVLREALALPVPPEIRPAHRRVVQQDLLFRIARAELDGGHSAAALAAADRGLALGGDTDIFRANLWIARGEALVALGRDTEAASSYYEALELNRKLLSQVLGAVGAGTP